MFALRILLRATTIFALFAWGLTSTGCRSRASENSESSQGQTPRADAARADTRKASPIPPPPPPSPPSAPAVPPTAPSSIQRVSGTWVTETVAQSKAKGTLVNAWASWCGPCRREFPMLLSLKDNLSSRGIEVMFISVDDEESEGAALDFAGQHELELPLLAAELPLGPFKQALNPNWPGMLPATFLFDDKGKLRYFWGGPVYEQELLPIVESYLAGELVDGEANFALKGGRDFRQD